MDVTKAPPAPDLTSHLGAGAAAPSAATTASSAPNVSTALAAVADRLDIQPLDVATALQILIAEVRAGLPLLPDVSLPEPMLGVADVAAGARLSMPSMLTLLSSPAQAAPLLMRSFLQAVPEEIGNPAAWSATVTQLEVTLQSALDRAVSTVEQWPDVTQAVVDAARETRTLVMGQLGDGPPSPLWLRPEWIWFSPHIDRFRRRRRLGRRDLTDPDLSPLSKDEARIDEKGSGKDET
jgi:hypothetical protein